MSNIFVLFFIHIAISEADPRLISRLEKMSYEELVADDVSKVPFHEQVLVTFSQTVPRTNKEIIPGNITEIICLQRNRRMQVYLQDGLHKNQHFSSTMVHVYFICASLYEHIDAKDDADLPPITFVSASKKCFSSADRKLIVWNYVEGKCNEELEGVRDKVVESFESGFLSYFRYERSRRTITSDGSNVPVMHSGFSNSNAHQYKFCRSTQLGHTHPSLLTSYLAGTDFDCRRAIACALALANSLVDESPCAFKVDEYAPSSYRKELRKEHHVYFGLDSSDSDEVIKNFFKHEANSFMINHCIKLHHDDLNDVLPSMSGVVTTSICFDRKEEFFKDLPELNHYLDSIGYLEYMPYAQVSYSRKVCNDSSRRPDMMTEMIKNSTDGLSRIRRAVGEAVTETHGPSNYLNTYDKLNGLEFENILAAVNSYNNRQKMITKSVCVSKKDYYSDFKSRIGTVLQKEIEHATKQFNELQVLNPRTVPQPFQWTFECFNVDGENCLAPFPDPLRTYQGPIILMTASYCKMVSSFVQMS